MLRSRIEQESSSKLFYTPEWRHRRITFTTAGTKHWIISKIPGKSFNRRTFYSLELWIERVRADVRGRVLRVVRNDVLIFLHAFSVEAVLMEFRVDTINHGKVFSSHPYLSIAARRSFSGRSISDAISARGIEAEELRTHSLVLEARWRASIATTLRVQRQKCSGQLTTQGFVLMWSVVQAAGSVTADKV